MVGNSHITWKASAVTTNGAARPIILGYFDGSFGYFEGIVALCFELRGFPGSIKGLSSSLI